ncbi:EAL domain-containing protein [Comamonas testosteroni]|uniref:Diguanylate cyclase/phosphodiesterase with PAS/PAC sensor(S) n=2 Tax=Comamonas testosteroni TaxID=285 RepID=B7WQM1_COMTK|nr:MULTISPECIES: EAL domain-containing protein [Comamonas]AIJ47301.1 diguanylate cyclase [Comamonas testosteroni TK102]EED67016.1 diguanylate cyclase/phosphodiesterase with PAS/PAC sensor(s) [Comamonas testosteroni KF-1]MPS87769.1 EAL domain-containing protein [Comamonas sp.]WQG65224.1 EAL domain-containing protein [Comamonas testosteroni]
MQQRLQLSADMATRSLEQRLGSYDRLLAKLAEQMGSDADAGQQMFSQHAHALLSRESLVGLQALSLTRAVNEELHTDLARDSQAFEVSYVWPMIDNEALAGSNARQPAAAFHGLMQAWNSRQMSMSAPFRFLQLPDSPKGVALRAPLWPAATQEGGYNGSEKLLGTVDARIRLGEFARGLVPANLYPQVAFKLVDLSPADPLPKVGMDHKRPALPLSLLASGSEILFTGSLWAEAETHPEFAAIKPLERQIQVYDRIWSLQFKPALSSQRRLERYLPWLVLAAGLLAGLVLAAWVSGWWQSRWSWSRRLKFSAQARQESDARFHAMCEQAAMGVLELDIATRSVLKVNQHFCRLLGYEAQDIHRRSVLELVMPEDQAQCAQLLEGLDLQQFQHNAGEFCLRSKSGAPIWVELNAFLTGRHESRRLQVLVQDISGRKRLEQMERLGHQQLRSLMQRLPVGLVMEDLDGRLVYWNEEFLRLAGYGGKPSVSTQQWWERMFPDTAERERVIQRWQVAKAQASRILQLRRSEHERVDGQDAPWDELATEAAACTVSAQTLMLRGLDGLRRPVAVSAVLQADGCLMVLQDQSQRMAAEQEVRRLAFYDALTGLPNRRLLADRLQQALAMAQRKAHFGGVVLLDIDNFKAFNEAYGLDQGDLLLQSMSQRIRGLLPSGATIARQGGDDFVLLIEDLGGDSVAAAARLEQQADQWLNRLREPIEIGGVLRSITVSMGLSLFGEPELTGEEVQRRAEMAMYQAKSQGRNVSCFFDPQLQSALQERRTLEQDMRAGLQAGEFELFYQPQVEMGKVIGAEGLLRWKHPEKGFVPPAHFIPLAEETGVILPLGDWVLRAACQQLAKWAKHPRYAQLVLSVNVSPKQFHQSGFVEQVLKALAEHGADARRLKLELTEGMLVADVDDTIAKMMRLKSYGIGFSLDDFGTGYSSLSYLKRLPLDQLKIDRSFVRDVLTDPNDAAIARTIVALAKSLGLHVIAEGVETQAQCRFLEGIRCYAWQGYLMSPPVPVGEFEGLVTNGNVPGSATPALSPVSMR